MVELRRMMVTGGRQAGVAVMVGMMAVGCAKEADSELTEVRREAPDRESSTTTDGGTMTEADDDTATSRDVLGRGAPDPAPPAAALPADALEITTLVEGTGPGAVAGDTLTVHYVGKLADGSVFDESWSGGEPFPVTLGQGMVIPGWEQGLLGAKAGERRRLEMGADQAYGSTGQGSIPPDAPLAFEVDVLAIQPGG